MARLSDEDFARLWQEAECSPAGMARLTGMDQRSIYKRREKLVGKGFALPTIATGNKKGPYHIVKAVHRHHTPVEIGTGCMIVFSDAHYWPGHVTVAHKALVEAVRQLQPQIIVANGDVLDGARIGRHARIGWETAPTVKQELEAVEERLQEIQLAARKGTRFYWTWGNHCLRFNTFLSGNAEAFEGVPGMSLEERFPEWDFAMALDVNGQLVVKHRWHNGIHAGYNNALKSGRSICTGHLHRLLVTPWGDFNGRRWGIDTGTLAETDGPQFGYMEGNAAPWCSGFAVISWHEGQMLPPELVEVIDNRAWFRGQMLYDGQA